MKNARLLGLLALLVVVVGGWWYLNGPLTLKGELERFVRTQALKNGSIAIAHRGQIIESFEIGASRAEAGKTLRPIASLSKLLTAQTIVLLVRDGKIQLNDKLSDLLPDLPYAIDEGYSEITVQQLLQHTAGFDRSKSGDPLFEDGYRVRGCDAAVRTAVSRPLDNPPGRITKYSNVGYCLLGMLIEHTTGQSYESAVRFRLLQRGEDDRLTLGYAGKNAQNNDAIFSQADWRGLGAAGGWFTDAETLSRLLGAQRIPNLELPPISSETDKDFYYGQSWRVWLTPYHRWTHYGAVPGFYAFAMQLPDDWVAVAIFEDRPSDDESAAVTLIKIFESFYL